MRCPACSFPDDKVVDSRVAKDGAGVRRRRECLSCGYRFTTYEGIIPEELKVIKRNGEREDFDRDKLRRGIVNACYKRPIEQEAIERMITELSAAILRDFDREVTSSELGNRVMEKLKSVDEVAYVRFGSVYRKFQAIEDFGEFINEIRSRK